MRPDHELKTWPTPFSALWHKSKTHEIRKADRNYQLWDVLHLREWDPIIVGRGLRGSGTDVYHDVGRPRGFTGRWILTEVTYITRGGEWGLPNGLVVMSVRTIEQGTQLWPST